MPDTLIRDIQKLTADEIASRIDRLHDEERTLRVLLRSARARERAQRERQKKERNERGRA
jgi:hypothetical protein